MSEGHNRRGHACAYLCTLSVTGNHKEKPFHLSYAAFVISTHLLSKFVAVFSGWFVAEAVDEQGRRKSASGRKTSGLPVDQRTTKKQLHVRFCAQSLPLDQEGGALEK